MISSAAFLHLFDTDSPTPIKQPLQSFPHKIGVWQSSKSQTLQKDIARMLNVDDYIFRTYHAPNGLTISFYVSFFAYTDRTKGYHSPLNCMPGSGWNIAQTRPIQLSLNNQQQKKVTVNQLILQKGSQKQVALYWYQCRGRIIHSEYWERIYRVWDSIIRGRTDGSFVRLIYKSSSRDLDKATLELKDFAKAVIPTLSNYLP